MIENSRHCSKSKSWKYEETFKKKNNDDMNLQQRSDYAERDWREEQTMTRKQSRVSSKHKQRDETQKKDVQNNNSRHQNKCNETFVRWIQKNKRR